MKVDNRLKLLLFLVLIFVAAISMSFLIKQIDFHYKSGIAPKRVTKEAGYHTVAIIDWRDKTVVRLGDFQTNVAVGENGHRFLKTRITVKTTSEATSKEIRKYNVIVRDRVIKTLGSRHFDQVKSEEGKKELKDTIQADLNAFLKEGKVKEVYFTEFLMI